MSISTYSESLRDSRRAARRFGVDVKGITAHRWAGPSNSGPIGESRQYYEVWQHGKIVWTGYFYDAVEAKHDAIEAMIQGELKQRLTRLRRTA